jgi:hypothetical protein
MSPFTKGLANFPYLKDLIFELYVAAAAFVAVITLKCKGSALNSSEDIICFKFSFITVSTLKVSSLTNAFTVVSFLKSLLLKI